MSPRAHDGGGAAVPLGRHLARRSTCPNEATVDDVREIYEEGWSLGLKAVALYRDGCKASQPLSTTSRQEEGRRPTPRRRTPLAPMPKSAAAAGHRAARACRSTRPARHARPPAEEAPRLHAGGARRRPQGLPAHRRVRGRHARRDLHRHAQGRRRLPLADELLRDERVDRPAVRRAARDATSSSSRSRASSRRASSRGTRTCKFATSIVDYIFRVLGVEYLRRYDLAHVKPERRGRAARRLPRRRHKEDRVSDVRDARCRSQLHAGGAGAQRVRGGDARDTPQRSRARR